MKKKTLALILVFWLFFWMGVFNLFPVITVMADKSTSTEEVWVQWRRNTNEGSGGTQGTGYSNRLMVSEFNLTYQYEEIDADAIGVYYYRGYIYSDDTDTRRVGWFAYQMDAVNDPGAYIGSQSAEVAEGPTGSYQWRGYSFSQIMIDSSVGMYGGHWVFFFGMDMEYTSDSGLMYHGRGEGAGEDTSGYFSRDDSPPNYPSYEDPLVETGDTLRLMPMRIRFWGYRNKTTTYNQYFGDSENYTARRDVNYTFPTGVDSKQYRITFPAGEALVNITYSNGGLWNQYLSEGDYTIGDLNATHKLITIANTPISLYGPEFRVFTQSYNYIYNLYGPFYENGTNAGSITVTATRADKSEEIDIDGYYLYTNDSPTTMFTWVLSEGETRRYYPIPPTENIYIFEPDATYATYGFDIRDYPGIIGTNVCFLEAIRSVNGTDRVVERTLIWNTHSTIPLILVKNKVYLLRVRLEDGSYYTFGYFTPGDYAPPTLSITGLGWSDYYQPTTKWVQMDITRPNATHIKMVYNDDLLLTVGVDALITFRNGTEVWSDYQSEDTYTFNWYGATGTTEYIAFLYANHGLYGNINCSATLLGVIDPDAPPDFSPIGVTPTLLSVFLILAGAGTVSRYNKVAGMFTASVIASLLTFMNWIAIPYEVLAVAFALSILSGLGGR